MTPICSINHQVMPKSNLQTTNCLVCSPSSSQPTPLISITPLYLSCSQSPGQSHPHNFHTAAHPADPLLLFYPYLQPVTNNNPWMLLYFISFLLIVSFFVLNMFVGVVVENFHKCRQHQEAEEARRREEKRLRRLEKKRRSKAQPKCLVGS